MCEYTQSDPMPVTTEINVSLPELMQFIHQQPVDRPLNMFNSTTEGCGCGCLLVALSQQYFPDAYMHSAGFCTVHVRMERGVAAAACINIPTDVTNIIPLQDWRKLRCFGDLQQYLKGLPSND